MPVPTKGIHDSAPPREGWWIAALLCNLLEWVLDIVVFGVRRENNFERPRAPSPPPKDFSWMGISRSTGNNNKNCGNIYDSYNIHTWSPGTYHPAPSPPAEKPGETMRGQRPARPRDSTS